MNDDDEVSLRCRIVEVGNDDCEGEMGEVNVEVLRLIEGFSRGDVTVDKSIEGAWKHSNPDLICR